MKEHLQSVVTLLSLVNPMVCAMMFAKLTVGRTRSQRISDATRALLIVGVVLVIAALAGARILGVFGVSLDVFSVAGGIVLAFIGFNMLVGSKKTDTPSPDHTDTTLAPMILFAASPGTITGVITIAASHSGTDIPTTALVGIAVVIVITWSLLLVAASKSVDSKAKGSNLASDMVSRYMGLIVIAMGIQYALNGYKAFMAA